jgi:hypothetical protein
MRGVSSDDSRPSPGAARHPLPMCIAYRHPEQVSEDIPNTWNEKNKIASRKKETLVMFVVESL